MLGMREGHKGKLPRSVAKSLLAFLKRAQMTFHERQMYIRWFGGSEIVNVEPRTKELQIEFVNHDLYVIVQITYSL